MTEAEWLACEDLEPMLEFLRSKASDRKLRLFACACCRRIWHLLTDKPTRHLLSVGELYADGKVDREDLAAARHAVPVHSDSSPPGTASFHGPTSLPTHTFAVFFASGEVGGTAFFQATHAARQAARAVNEQGAGASATAFMLASRHSPDGDWPKERSSQTRLIRHMIGNPFRPYPIPDSWPQTVNQLAAALYEGQDCSFALHDALQAGHPELAAHFQAEKWHPKGCWVVDVILGKA